MQLQCTPTNTVFSDKSWLKWFNLVISSFFLKTDFQFSSAIVLPYWIYHWMIFFGLWLLGNLICQTAQMHFPSLFSLSFHMVKVHNSMDRTHFHPGSVCTSAWLQNHNSMGWIYSPSLVSPFFCMVMVLNSRVWVHFPSSVSSSHASSLHINGWNTLSSLGPSIWAHASSSSSHRDSSLFGVKVTLSCDIACNSTVFVYNITII